MAEIPPGPFPIFSTKHPSFFSINFFGSGTTTLTTNIHVCLFFQKNTKLSHLMFFQFD